MIYIFVTREHRYTIIPFLTTWPNLATALIRLVPYEDLHKIRSIQSGLFIFTDIDRLTPQQKMLVSDFCRQITLHFGAQSILNHPSRVLGRYELLRQLYSNGINRFRVYSWTEREEKMAYPVFLRCANDHFGPRTQLIKTREVFLDLCHQVQEKCADTSNWIAVEFCNTLGKDGLYRKYAAFRIGDMIVPGHIIYSDNWVTKDSLPEPLRDEENTYLENNPHQDELMRIFRLANIEYGRIDYALLDGNIQVWEINTNPVLIQQQSKYSVDKLPIKLKLVAELAHAFRTQKERTVPPEGKQSDGHP